MSAVGIIVNPWAGKDVRRLHAPVGHTPDTAKVGIVRRIAIGALEAGATQIFVARDVGRIAERAVRDLERITLVDGPSTGSALDTRRAATQLAELGCATAVILGGDGTCRDVAIGWPDATMIPVSTGTNNVFPSFVDGSSAGTAAGLVATGVVPVGSVARRAKLISIAIDGPTHDGPTHDVALVDVGVIGDVRIGARAVVRPEQIRLVVAAIAHPASTGLSAIAGRLHPIDRSIGGGVVVRLGGHSRVVRVPIVPGTFDELAIESVDELELGAHVTVHGPCVLAYDGERDRVLRDGDVATITIDATGPFVVDVERALHCAVRQHHFDVRVTPSGMPNLTTETPHGN